ncbi:MAG: 30S ribosomal protein S4 [Nanoarchaeota archaeon]|nr:30S ribosomal protein S4 [Nanoarchaeota archaeon]
MGDPRKIRKSYSTPSHPWQKTRIEEESVLTKKYALKNKKEIWKMSSILKDFKNQAKKLGSVVSKQGEKEKELLLKRLISTSLLKEGDKTDSILILKIESIMERRLQAIVYNKGMARSMKQARQFITHRHIKVNNKVISSPSYLVSISEEDKIKFKDKSSLADPENPERKILKVVESKKEKKEETKKTKKKSMSKNGKR